MKKLATPLAILFLHVCAFGQSNWQRVTTGINSSATVASVTASGQLALGVVTGDPSIQTVRSTDGGQSWNDELTQPALKLKALSSSFIYGVRGSAIMTSTTQGISWTSISPAFNGLPVDVHYINATQAFAVGNSTAADSIFVAVTTNNWTGFTSSFLPTDSALAVSIQFVDNQTGFILARSIKSADSNAALIFRTTNSGGLWTKQGALPDTCLPPSSLILAADFVDASTGWAAQTCGTSATIYKTADGGANWAADTTLLTFQAFAIDAFNLQSAWVAGRSGVNGAIVRTGNSGSDWNAEAVPSSPATGVLLSISMLDLTHGFASGQSATLLRYVPSGTGVDDGPSNRPKTFDLHQNYPNPFNAGTKISFFLLKREKVRLAVYNILGERVAMLHEGELPAGRHEFNWNGADRRGRTLSTGLYLYELRTSEERQVRKMILLK
jgi:photosystem II stability/assembly factor-like uncharacterized protein